MKVALQFVIQGLVAYKPVGYKKISVQGPLIRPFNNLENKTFRRVQLVCEKVQAQSSLEPLLEYNQYQTPLMNRG